jgi:autotransporter-associated beta strand protein
MNQPNPSLRFPVVAGVFAALLGASHAQTTITYVDGEDKTDPIVLDIANSPVSLSIDAGAATQSGVISESDGSFGITKIGDGMLTLAAVNTYTGSTILDGGTLAFTADNAVGALDFGAAPGSVNVSTLDLSGASLSATSLTVQTASTSANTITIGSGRSLDITGPTTIGVGDQSTPTILEVSGEGSLNITGGNFIMAPNNASTANSVTVDLSGLSHFTYNDAASQFRVAGGIPNNTGNRANGTLTLANTTNTITASAVVIGGGSSGNGGTATLNLGAGTNVINADTINIGFNKHTSTVQWLPETTTGTLKIRGTGGTDEDRATITIGSRFNSGSAVGPDNVDLNGHEIDILAGALTVGRVDQLSGTATTETANLSFDFGVIDATSLTIADRSGNRGTAIGTLTVGGDAGNTALLKVGTGGFTLTSTNGASASTTATLNINVGGVVESLSDIAEAVGSTGTSNVNLNGGTLNLMGNSLGTADAPIDTLTLADGALQNVAEIHVGTLIRNGTGEAQLPNVPFTGDVTVQAGTLVLTAPSLDDASSVSLFTGGLLALNFSDTDTIAALTLDGIPSEFGTWGAIGNTSADFNSELITGNGMLFVIPEPGVVALALVGLAVVLFRVRRLRTP